MGFIKNYVRINIDKILRKINLKKGDINRITEK